MNSTRQVAANDCLLALLQKVCRSTGHEFSQPKPKIVRDLDRFRPQ
jgi:hypothetical protein